MCLFPLSYGAAEAPDGGRRGAAVAARRRAAGGGGRGVGSQLSAVRGQQGRAAAADAGDHAVHDAGVGQRLAGRHVRVAGWRKR